MAAAAAGTAAPVIKYLLGQCIPTVKKNASRFRIKKLKFDERINMYFNDYTFVFAYDPDKICKTGDTVLIQTLPEKMTTLVTHKVIKIVYPLGDITDPITNRKVVVSRFRDDIKAINQIYGESDEAFDYDKEPPRGKTQGIRDFTHKPGTIKFHEFEDPTKNPPHAM